MTGTDEWRLIHVNGGVFTDSLTVKPPAIKGATSAADMASASAASAGSSTASNPGDASPQAQQRWQVQRGGQPLPGDVAANLDAQGVPVVPPGQPGDGSAPGMAPPGAPQPGDPGYAPGMILPGQPGYQPGMDVRVERLDPPVQALRETGHLLHRCHRQAGRGQRRSGRSGGDDLHSGLDEGAAELG